MAKKYKCPYCNDRLIRKDLIDHIDEEHEELIPDNFESSQVVYDLVNGTKGAGRCRVCSSATEWNTSSKRYDTLCKNPKCKQKMREDYQKNMLRVHGTYNILTSDEQQKKMLANRSISGKYKFTDGGIVTYTGSYEKKFLEFADKVMQIPSKDIMAPGPTLEYEMNGEKHFYITDFLYIPYNLIIEVKDGGSNPNNKNTPGMKSSRQRTIEKEKLITDRGEYNYLRLTDNQFVQLLEIFMDIKKALIEGNDDKIIRINESHLIPNTDADDRYEVYCKTIKALENNGIKTKVSKKDIDNFVNCVDTDFGHDLCIAVGINNVKKAVNIVNPIIKSYGGKLQPDNYGTVFLSVNESYMEVDDEPYIFTSGDFDEYKEYGEQRLKEIQEENKKVYLSESGLNQNLTKFGAYHLEPTTRAKSKIYGGWDEEIYSKSIELAIHNDIRYKYQLKDETKVSAYVYTAGKNLEAIYLGKITIFDKENPNDWEWEEQETLDKKTYDYLKNNPLLESTTDINNFYEEDYG